jgi:hypothetical protein
VIHEIGTIGAGKDDVPRSDPKVLAVRARVRGASIGRCRRKQKEGDHQDNTDDADAAHLVHLMSGIPGSSVWGDYIQRWRRADGQRLISGAGDDTCIKRR